MFKIMKEEAPNYLINLIPKCEKNIKTSNILISTYHCRKDCFRKSFFLSTLNDWFDLGNRMRNSESISIFKGRLLPFVLPIKSNVYRESLTQKYQNF